MTSAFSWQNSIRQSSWIRWQFKVFYGWSSENYNCYSFQTIFSHGALCEYSWSYRQIHSVLPRMKSYVFIISKYLGKWKTIFIFACFWFQYPTDTVKHPVENLYILARCVGHQAERLQRNHEGPSCFIVLNVKNVSLKLGIKTNKQQS